MGFEELAQELHKGADAEGKKLINAAQGNAKKMEEDASEKAEEGIRAAKKDASLFVKQESGERMTSAKLAAKKMVDEARDEAVEASLRQMWQAFKSESQKKDSYQQILERLIKDGLHELGSTEATVYVRDEDRTLVSG